MRECPLLRLLIAPRPVSIHMTEETMTATTTVNAAACVVFDVLANPYIHEAIDGTGWVRQPLGGKRLTATGQVFRMAMYYNNPNYTDKNYEVATASRYSTRRTLLRGFPAKVLTTPISNSADGSGATTSSLSGSQRRRSH